MKLRILLAACLLISTSSFAAASPAARLASATAAAAPATNREPAAKPKLADLNVTITGFRNLNGHLLVSVFGERDGGFPDQANRAVFKRSLPCQEGMKFIVEVPPGNYAVAVLHDANDNQKMDKALGIPKEGFGFSNNAMKPFGPPTFDMAKVAVPAGGTTTSIKIKYML